jgi:hypothetical protein
MPITEVLNDVLFGGVTLEQGLQTLMARTMGPEHQPRRARAAR